MSPGGEKAARRTRNRMTDDVIATRARALAGALAESGFARLRVRDGETEIELRRAPRTSPAAVAIALLSADPDRAAERPPDRAEVVSSDVVGIVRLMRPAIAEGQELEGDREVAYVETLGIRNPVRSRGAGRVSAVFVTDGQPVEYGQPLFTIER
ncbi:MAG: acetyl-CoA carboxylase, biotin carboxyl carrier protein [Candidatus Eremiobacteraeota bacterium]|nr:acetyl-CoA carboxylase, biotin carboxyl carrier protein [Candidatus Eremiobacteraeota bacterium]